MVKFGLSVLFVMVMIALANGIKVGNRRHKELEMENEKKERLAVLSFTTFGFPVAVLFNGIYTPFESHSQTVPADVKFKNEQMESFNPYDLMNNLTEEQYEQLYAKDLGQNENYNPEEPYPYPYPYPMNNLTEEQYEQLYAKDLDQNENYNPEENETQMDDEEEESSQSEPIDMVFAQGKSEKVYYDTDEGSMFEFPFFTTQANVKSGDILTIVYQSNPIEQRGIIGLVDLIDPETKMTDSIETGEKWRCNYYNPGIVASNKGETCQQIPIYSDSASWIDIPVDNGDTYVLCSIKLYF